MKHTVRFASYGVLVSTVILVATTGVVQAAVPSLLNYQGILKDDLGDPQTGTFSVTFRIYPTPVGGPVPLWEETQNVTSDALGLFNVLLGTSVALDESIFSASDRWLGIDVEGDGEMIPRIQFVTVAYAHRVATVADATGGRIDGEIAIHGAGFTDDQIVLGVSDPNVALELRSGASGGQPFIDFANDNASDFDARIQLESDGLLKITGELDVSGMENKIRFHYDAFGDLPSPSTYHGMFAHVHADAKAYYAHAAQWVPLANEDHTHDGSDVVDESLTKDDIVDEPGAAQIISGGLGLAAGVQDITSRVITCPAAGYVLALASCRVAFGHVNGTTSQTRVGVSNISATFPGDQDKEFRIPSSAPTDTWVSSLSPQKVFSVSAGANTFYVVGNLLSGNATVSEVTLSLVYLPSAHGTVTE